MEEKTRAVRGGGFFIGNEKRMNALMNGGIESRWKAAWRVNELMAMMKSEDEQEEGSMSLGVEPIIRSA